MLNGAFLKVLQYIIKYEPICEMLQLIAFANRECSDEPAHARSLGRVFDVCIHKVRM